MQLESLKTVGFRNLAGSVELGNGRNILLGENGQGKTNWLESVHILATARSFRTTRLSETINFDTSQAVLNGMVRRTAGIVRELTAVLEASTKAFSVNGKKESIQRYLGQMHSVVFNADELEIIRGQPDARRRFLDAAIVSIHPPFVQTLSDYARVLRQKNSLLQTAKAGEYSLEKTAELLAPWNEQLIVHASRIHRSRLRYVSRLNEVLEKKLFDREEVSIRYRSALEGKGDISEFDQLLSERLALRIPAEMAAGHSLIGPHRDDLDIFFDGRDLRKFGSAGQQRSALLLMQLANISVYYAQQNEYPIFLLDDIDAELDFRRIGRLLEYLDGKTQTIITTSKESFKDEFGSGAKILRVRNGRAEA